MCPASGDSIRMLNIYHLRRSRRSATSGKPAEDREVDFVVLSAGDSRSDCYLL